MRLLRNSSSGTKPNKRSITAAKKNKRRKVKAKKMENKKPQKPKGVGHFQNFDFCVCPRKNVAKRDASGKKGKLPSCFRCLFD